MPITPFSAIASTSVIIPHSILQPTIAAPPSG
jgi:hypothetical protein